MKRGAWVLLLSLAAACFGDGEGGRRVPREAVFVGIDVSGSFRKAGAYDDSLEFLAYYLYGHLHGLGGLHPLKALFVGAIGGEFEDEPKSFHPIHDFEGKSVEQIHEDLKTWFAQRDHLSDFNVFFKQAAHIAQKRNLSLSPITVILLSDGVPAVPGAQGEAEVGKYEDIDLAPLEYLSRKVTVRLLYADPRTSSKWEQSVPRQRVRMWTQDQQVMSGWKAQLDADAEPEGQERLWKWVLDIVDFRVRPVKLRLGSKA